MLHTEKGDYELKFTYNALCAYEEKYGRSMIRDQRRDGFAVVRGMVWAGLQHIRQADGTHITEEGAGEIIEQAILAGADVPEIREQVNSALNEATFIQRLIEKSTEKISRKKQSGK